MGEELIDSGKRLTEDQARRVAEAVKREAGGPTIRITNITRTGGMSIIEPPPPAWQVIKDIAINEHGLSPDYRFGATTDSDVIWMVKRNP